MRNFYITFVSDDVDKMRIFGALLDAGMENFVITEDVSTVAENAQVEFIRCKDCTFFHSGYCELRNDKADGETLVCPSFLIRPKRIELIEG